MKKRIVTNILAIIILSFSIEMACSSKSIGSTQKQDEHDKKYTYRGGPIASRDERETWDVINKEFAAQDRADANANAREESRKKSGKK